MINTLISIHAEYLRQGCPLKNTIGKRWESKPGETRIRVSSLGSCPIKTAMTRLGREGERLPIPHGKLCMFEEGSRVGEIWGEAMLWHYKDRAKLEPTLENAEIVGHADIIIDKTVLEIKRTESFEIRESHRLQLQAYMMLAGAEAGYLVYQRRDKVDIFEVERNDENVQAAIEQHNAMLEALKNSAPPAREIGDMLPYECCSQSRKQMEPYKWRNELRPGNITPACDYFRDCYGIGGSAAYATQWGEDGSLTASLRTQ